MYDAHREVCLCSQVKQTLLGISMTENYNRLTTFKESLLSELEKVNVSSSLQ
jgi:hypothetical protein